ncbi:MAG: hypothetical protein HY471_00635, partial [Candidatus Sungbacteria bacterium]|nr:hypothetical protein [Candidatus Sungbacteria bacterium]
MKVKKILIVPAESIVEKSPASWYGGFFVDVAKYAKRKLGRATSVYDAELQRYADIPKVLGAENVLVFGKLYPHFYSSELPRLCPYPSCHGAPRARIVSESGMREAINAVDAVLVSARAEKRGEAAIAAARKRNIPVAIIDAHDHQSNYGKGNLWPELCRGFKHKEHFDIYFKNDLPLGYKTEYLFPLAPCPLRPESYKFRELFKDTDLFFSGKMRARDQDDGRELLAMVRSSFGNIRFFEHAARGEFLSFSDYWNFLSRSRIALSPSRSVWDSFRHCETGLAPGTALVAPRPYLETVGPPLIDGANSILYDTELRNGKYHLTNAAELIEKMRHYL